MKLKISSWNVNGIRARIEEIPKWLKEYDPDILCLNETKCLNEDFPSNIFEELGYNLYLNGQKSFNGVAIFSKYELTDIDYHLYPGTDDEQARFIEAKLNIPDNPTMIINCIYLPNGNPYPSEKFDYKLEWMGNLLDRAKINMSSELPYIILGDFNIIPTENDVYDHTNWLDDALFRIEARKKYRQLTNLGLFDAYLLERKSMVEYTHWDYQGGAWDKNHGVRIDHILLSPAACYIFKNMRTHTNVRGSEKPSDHVPISAEFILV